MVAAALIMMAVFSGFIGSGDSIVKTIGLGLAVAVLLDAFVVRMVFVPRCPRSARPRGMVDPALAAQSAAWHGRRG
ncbi:hypothetical protein [Streptomyces fuscichromogenes]|uniref:hypothetical protein n=1 Tax=Streptomyces fuscichromogenes TaxID=1324013 RepID=UPI003570C1E6